MKQFDRFLHRMASEEAQGIPPAAQERIASVLASLPERPVSVQHRRKSGYVPQMAMAAACFALIALVILPNISPAYAQTVGQFPIIGRFVRVITIRNYVYEDESHEMNIEVPAIQEEGARTVNDDIDRWTEELVQQFYDELEITGGSGYGSIYVDYEPVTDTEHWFTLKLSVHEIAAGSNSYFKYYHIDKRTGETVRLGDLFADESSGDALAGEIQSQMRQQMEENSDIVYWLDDPDPEFAFSSLAEDHNFYFNENGELVIPFDKYEVAPGYMGCPVFVIPSSITEEFMNESFMNIP